MLTLSPCEDLVMTLVTLWKTLCCAETPFLVWIHPQLCRSRWLIVKGKYQPMAARQAKTHIGTARPQAISTNKIESKEENRHVTGLTVCVCVWKRKRRHTKCLWLITPGLNTKEPTPPESSKSMWLLIAKCHFSPVIAIKGEAPPLWVTIGYTHCLRGSCQWK